MNRPWKIWLLFSLCVAVLFAATGWVSATAIRLNREQAEARCQAALEESARLALWRMDSAIAPLIAQENTRPYFVYSAFYSNERGYPAPPPNSKAGPGGLLAPSPLLTAQTNQVLLHFQFGPDGVMTSPQVPPPSLRDLAEARNVRRDRLEVSEQRLQSLQKFLTRGAAVSAMRLEKPLTIVTARPATPQIGPQGGPNQAAQQQVSQADRNIEEYNARFQNAFANSVAMQQQAASAPDTRTFEEGVLAPAWINSNLFLLRRVRVDGRDYVQGCWLDWESIKQSLLTEVRPLLPSADLVPAAEADGGAISASSRARALGVPAAADPGRLMAALPVKLVPGPAPWTEPEGASPIRLSLGIAWTCALLAATGGALVLAGAVALSERRAAFVSTVTHELRTPLTTLRMYTEMLAGEMVPDQSKRREYLETLRAEAERLGLLVENVLAYARLERGRAAVRAEAVSLEELLSRQRERLSERTRQAGMQLVSDDGDGWATVVRVDASAAEQILFNLVDNACKYAASSSDRRIHLQAARRGEFAVVRVSDHGPGISRKDARRLFQAFRKIPRDRANSAPGIGLGLALSRRLAREMGGDLRLERDSPAGACFELYLPCQ